MVFWRNDMDGQTFIKWIAKFYFHFHKTWFAVLFFLVSGSLGLTSFKKLTAKSGKLQ